MLPKQRLYLNLCAQGLLIVTLFALTSLTSTVKCTTTRTSNNCHNETRQITVNESVSEWCAGYGVWCYATEKGCYCEVYRLVTRDHTTVVCEGDILSESITSSTSRLNTSITKPADSSAIGALTVPSTCQCKCSKRQELTLVDGDDIAETGSVLGGRKLTDPEVAAIAVICSLIFSILLSLSVFFIQRRHRSCLAQKNNRAHIVQVERGQPSPDSEEVGEDDKFLPPTPKSKPGTASGSTDRYITVSPANREMNVYEDVQPGQQGKAAAGKKAAVGKAATAGEASAPDKLERVSLIKGRSDSTKSDNQYIEMTSQVKASSVPPSYSSLVPAPKDDTNRHSADSYTQTESNKSTGDGLEKEASKVHYENEPVKQQTESLPNKEPDAVKEKSVKSSSKNSLTLNISEDDLYENFQTSEL